MFTRRTLFKLLAAIGVGSLWPNQGRRHEKVPGVFSWSRKAEVDGVSCDSGYRRNQLLQPTIRDSE